jgi:hypothetical protein
MAKNGYASLPGSLDCLMSRRERNLQMTGVIWSRQGGVKCQQLHVFKGVG